MTRNTTANVATKTVLSGGSGGNGGLQNNCHIVVFCIGSRPSGQSKRLPSSLTNASTDCALAMETFISVMFVRSVLRFAVAFASVWTSSNWLGLMACTTAVKLTGCVGTLSSRLLVRVELLVLCGAGVVVV